MPNLNFAKVLIGDKKQQAAAGFEPANNGFANRRLRPLGHAANLKTALSLPPISRFCNKIKCHFALSISRLFNNI